MFERRFLKHTMPRVESTVNLLHVWTIASLSVHRYWKISRPVVSRFKDTARRANYVLLVMFAVALLYRLPIFFLELQVKLKPILRVNRRPETTELLSPYRIVYHSFLDPVLSNFLPFTWMCIFSLLTLCEILKSRHFAYAQFTADGGSCRNYSTSSKRPLTYIRRRADSIRQKQEFRATVSIILIILLYLLFHSLQLYNVFRKWQLLLQKKCPT
ncbi:Protein C09F12.3, partial [Aphelenchoides avenae]